MILIESVRNWLETSNSSNEWRQTTDRTYLKEWRRGSEVVEVRVINSAQASYYDSSKENPTRHILTNGHASVPDAVWVAKLFMNYEIVLPACPLRVESEGEGIRHTSVPMRVVRNYVESSELDEPEAVEEFLQRAHRGDLGERTFD